MRLCEKALAIKASYEGHKEVVAEGPTDDLSPLGWSRRVAFAADEKRWGARKLNSHVAKCPLCVT